MMKYTPRVRSETAPIATAAAAAIATDAGQAIQALAMPSVASTPTV